MYPFFIRNISIPDIVYIYLILSLILTVVSVIRMKYMSRKACGKWLAKQRIRQLSHQGRFRQYPIYSIQEIKEHKKRGAARLSVFFNDTGKTTKCVIVCPGGGYAHLDTWKDGYPVAAKLNQMGYTAFVLEYRAGFDCSSHAPMHDLAQAVRFIEARQDEFHVDMEGYAVIGFSAGGNLAGTFGTHAWGYDKYNARKPGCLILGYPWTNVNHWFQHPYWNVWVAVMGIWCSERGNICMFRQHFMNKKNRDSLCVQKWITDDYPPTYMFGGGDDILVPTAAHTDVLERALKSHNVPYMYEKFYGLTHLVGIALNTNAEGWLDNAVRFWKEHI